MSDKKKSFVLYHDLIFSVRKLSDDSAGRLFKYILHYVNDEEFNIDDPMADVLFETVKQQLNRDLEKWQEIRELRSLAGKASANKRQQTSTHVDKREFSSTNRTVSVTDNVTVTVNDNVNDNQNKSLKGREHFEHLKSFFSKPYQQQTQEFKKLYTEKEYNDFGKFLKAMLNDFQEQLEQKFDKCLSIGEWKSIFKCAGYMRVKPAIIKTLGAAQGDRQNMAARIFTYTGEEFTDKAFKL